MSRTILWALLPLCLTLTGCPQVFDALTNSTNPHSLSATQGEGSTVGLSWMAPTFPSGDTSKVDSYTVYRDGSSIASGHTSTSYTDTGVGIAERHTYSVTAQLSGGTQGSRTSGSSNAVEGWYVPAQPLRFGLGPGTTSTSASSWYKTLVVQGWTYTFSGTSTLSVRADRSPWDQVGTGSGAGSVTWTANRTGKVWVYTSGSTTVEAWY